jgi:hypothetical protein
MSIFLNITIGIILAVCFRIISLNITEGTVTNKYGWAVFIIGIFAMFYYLPTYNYEINNTLLFISFYITGVILEIRDHFLLLDDVKSESNKWYKIWIFNKMKKRNGFYVENYLHKNAYASRFGLVVLGKKSFFNTLFGGLGWSETEKNGLLWHERGHNIVALPIIFIENLGLYVIFNNILIDYIHLLLAPAILFAYLTLISWLDELLADSFAGYRILAVGKALEMSLSDSGSVGTYSHPPTILRYFVGIFSWPFVVIGLYAYFR